MISSPTKSTPQSLASLLPPSFFDYEFTLPEVSLRAGLSYLGSNYRLRAAIDKALSGKRPFKVGFVGGSISTGHGASNGQVTAWIPTFRRWLEKVFPGIEVRNGCVAGTPSAYMVVCLEASVDRDVDVVFSEYILNDGKEDSIQGNSIVKETERLMRRILSMPGHPAFVFTQTFTHGMTFPFGHHEWRAFNQGIEEVYGALAQFYDSPVCSMRDATYRIAVHSNVSGYGEARQSQSYVSSYIILSPRL